MIIQPKKKYKFKSKYKSAPVYDDCKTPQELKDILDFKEKIKNKRLQTAKLKSQTLKKEVESSAGEKRIAKYLALKKINFKSEFIFTDLKNRQGNTHLRFDFYLPDKNICIEFDGIQHFKASKKFDTPTNTLQSRQENDKRKDLYCIRNKIALIRIKYNQYSEIEVILAELIKVESK